MADTLVSADLDPADEVISLYARKGAKFVFIINITIVLITNIVIIQKCLQTTQLYIYI